MEVRFGQHRVKPNEILSLALAGGDLNVVWPHEGTYTLMVYDLDAPDRSPYFHFWESNIPENDLDQGNVRIPWTPLAPPEGTHTYVVDLYRQTRALPRAGVNLEATPRENFPLEAVVRNHGLVLVERLVFQVSTGYQTRARAAATAQAGYLRHQAMKAAEDIPTDGRHSAQYSGVVAPVHYGKDGTRDWVEGLDEQSAKYCRAVLEVAAKEPQTCLQEKAWYQRREGKTCANPYAVAHKSVPGVTRIDCGPHYVLDKTPDMELIAYANLNGIELPAQYDRQTVIHAIQQWKGARGKA